MMQLFVKDASTMKHVYPQRVLLYTCADVCKEFFGGIEPCNLYLEVNRNRTYAIERHVRKMCKFNVALDAMVERLEAEDGSVLRLVDCKLVSN